MCRGASTWLVLKPFVFLFLFGGDGKGNSIHDTLEVTTTTYTDEDLDA